MNNKSEKLLTVAKKRIIANVPDTLASAIAVSGSVSLGYADEYSDLELDFLCDTMPSKDERRKWLEEISAINIYFREEPEEDGAEVVEFTLKVAYLS